MNNSEGIAASEQVLQNLVADADSSLEAFILLAKDFKLKMDYTLESLDEVEKLISIFKNKPEFEHLESDAWLYIGQCICKNFGGQWKVSRATGNEHYGLPVVDHFSGFNHEYCPMLEIHKFINRKRKLFFWNKTGKSFFRNKIESLRAGNLSV